MIDSALSELFWTDSIGKQLKIEYDGGILENNQIKTESMELAESLCSESMLRFGCCEASVFKICILNNALSLKGKRLRVSIVLDGHEDTPLQIGTYKVDSDKPTADRKYRDVIAYDALHNIINAEVSDWYNSLAFPTTLKAFRDSFFAYFDITQEETELVNDSMTVEETIAPSELSGLTVLSSICELNGCFGHINRQGNFEYKFLPSITSGLYPATDLYPSPDLFPSASNAERIGANRYISCKYEDYTTQYISKLQIRKEENDIGAIAGDGENCYIVQDNFLVYGKDADSLSTIAENVLSVIKNVSYRPFEATAQGNPCIEVGDAVRLNTQNLNIESYVLNRTMKGIQALKDSYNASGEELCAEKVNSVNKAIIQLRGKTNLLTRTVEETRLEIADIASGLSTRITQTAEAISTEAQRAAGAEESLSSRITQTAESIASEVTRAQGAEGTLSSRITQTAESIASEVTRATEAEGSLSSRITQTAESISSEVTRAQGAESSLSSRITQTAELVEVKVSKGDVSSQLSIESGQITIGSNRFVLNATNCSISANGTITASNVDLSGKITASSGTIGGMSIDSTSVKYGKIGINDGKAGLYIGTEGIAVGSGGPFSSAFKVTSSGDVTIGSAGGITIENGTPLTLTAPTAYIKHLTSNAIEFSSSKTNIISTYSVLGKYSGQIGFFGNNGAAKKSVSKASTSSSIEASAVATVVNNLIDALKAYNLIG